MSPSHVIGYHLLGNIRDCSNRVSPRVHSLLTSPSPWGVQTLPWFLLLQLVTWRSSRTCPPTLGGAHTASYSCMGYGQKQRGHHAETSDSHLRLHSITLCICTGWKISIIKRIFFFLKDPSET